MINRRSFMIASGLTALASTRVFGANDTLRIGVIGAGRRMKGLLDAADKVGARIKSSPSATSTARAAMRSRALQRPGDRPTSIITRCWRKDIDAVIIASPDHWHVRMAVDALAPAKTSIWKSPSRTRSKKAPC